MLTVKEHAVVNIIVSHPKELAHSSHFYSVQSRFGAGELF